MLLYKNIGADGVKTGYLAVEKYSLASTIKKKDRRLIAVVSGFPTKNIRSTDSLKLLNWGFRNTNTYEISKKEETIFELETWLGKKNKVTKFDEKPKGDGGFINGGYFVLKNLSLIHI